MFDILTVIVEMWFWVRSFFCFAKYGCENIHLLNILNFQYSRYSVAIYFKQNVQGMLAQVGDVDICSVYSNHINNSSKRFILTFL